MFLTPISTSRPRIFRRTTSVKAAHVAKGNATDNYAEKECDDDDDILDNAKTLNAKEK